MAVQVHADAVRLHHCRLTVDVDYQSRQQVALAVYQPVGVVLRTVGNADSLPHAQGRAKPLTPEVIADAIAADVRNVFSPVAELQHPHGNRPHLEMADGYGLPVSRQHQHRVALAQVIVYVVDSSREYPRMKPPQTLLFPFLQIYLLHSPVIISHLSFII